MGKSVQRAVPVYVCWLFEVPDWLLSLLSIVILFLADDNCTYEYHSTKSPPRPDLALIQKWISSVKASS